MNFTTAFGQKILPMAKAAAPVITKIKANSPTILLVGGCACIIGGGILMARAGWKAREIEDMVEMKIDGLDHLDRINDKMIDEHKQDIHREGTMDMAKQFILPGSLIVGGVGMVCCGFKIQGARLVAAVAYSAAVEQAFENYRQNVISDQGPSADARYMAGTHSVKTDIYTEEDGKVKKHKEEVVARGYGGSPYSRCFDDSNPNWVNDRSANMTWLLQKQEYINRILLPSKPDGVLTLNEVLEELGFPRTKEGQYVGWEYKPDPEKSLGDGMVDLGLSDTIFDDEIELARTERRNPEPSIWIDFNVDGLVIDKLGVRFR